MIALRRRSGCWFFVLVLAGSLVPAAASETSFPFGRELMLQAALEPGSKRVPVIEIEEDGNAAFRLWCASVRGSASVTDTAITLIPSQALSAQCTQEQISRDAALLAELSQVTTWRRDGEFVDFVGATTLRFRLMTN